MDSEQIRQLLDSLPIPVFVKGEDHSWIYGNEAFSDLIGLSDFIGKDDTTLFDNEQVEVFWREDDRVLDGERSTNFEEIGEGTFALTQKFPIKLRDGKPAIMGVIIQSVASPEELQRARSDYKNAVENQNALALQLEVKAEEHTKEYEERLTSLEQQRATAQNLAHTDPLTKIRNRLGLQADLQSLSKRCDERNTSFTLAFIDLDDFKHINDTFGHQMGDRVLVHVADRLRSFAPAFSVSRLGGDEFAVLIECDGQSPQQLDGLLQQMREQIFRPVTEYQRELYVNGSVGFTRYPFDTKNLSELKRFADLALMKVKRGGKGRVRAFEPSDHSEDLRLRKLESGLRRAIENKSISAVYQPIVESASGEIRGVEVLARWSHPELGPIAPDEFIFVAGRLGLLIQIDEIVLQNACRELGPLIRSGTIEYFSVNASPSDVASLGYADSFLARLQGLDIDPSSVIIEIIEAEVMERSSIARKNIESLSGAGVRIALDDFGSGYANYRTLLDLPINILKVDRSLIGTIGGNRRLVNFLVSIIQMANALDARTICEGIETAGEQDLARSLGFDAMQGFLLGRPMSAHQLTGILQRQMEESSSGQGLTRRG